MVCKGKGKTRRQWHKGDEEEEEQEEEQDKVEKDDETTDDELVLIKEKNRVDQLINNTPFPTRSHQCTFPECDLSLNPKHFKDHIVRKHLKNDPSAYYKELIKVFCKPRKDVSCEDVELMQKRMKKKSEEFLDNAASTIVEQVTAAMKKSLKRILGPLADDIAAQRQEIADISAGDRSTQNTLLDGSSLTSFSRGRKFVCFNASVYFYFCCSRMISPAGLVTKPQTEFVALSFRGFALWWVAIFLIHLSTFVFNACYAKFYWIFGSTQLSFSLDKYDVGMSREYFHIISYVHMALACLDGGLLLLMVVGSLRKRTLVFSPWSESTIKRKEARNRKNVVVRDQIGPLLHLTKRKSTVPMLRRASETYANIANRRGALGVNGRYFYTILVCREIDETAFQTEQAFRMSRYLSRFVLNRFYVSLLVINCWSPVLIHTRLLEKDEARRRLAAIVLDCALDLMSAMGVSIMIALTYVDEFDPELMGFSFELLDNNNWFAQMLDEARIVLVSSWLDLISRAVFGLGIVITTASMKELLRWKPIHKIDTRGPSTAELKQRGSVVPFDTRESVQTSGENLEHSGGYRCLIPRNFWCYNAHFTNRARRVLFQSVHCAFFAWGIVALMLHIQASRQSPLVECSPKVYPMAGLRPACFAVEFDCNRMKISGSREQVVQQLKRFDHTTVVKLHILHCPNLEIPEMFQEFKRLHEIWIYNSTVREWGPEAAVTNSCHPNLTVLSMIRTNMTDGRLPVGFQPVDFPVNLTEFYFCETNLRNLPGDIDDKWNLNTNIYIENSQLSVVSLSLIRLQPYFLSLAGNPIEELPPEMSETPAIQYIILRSTNVTELPQNVLNPPLPPVFIDLTGTNVAFFWSWIDPFIERMIGVSPRIMASGTPYCSDWDAIFGETKADFSLPFQQRYSKYLMNASKANWGILRQAIDCTPSLTTTQFNLEWSID